jgi:hypothetical protein
MISWESAEFGECSERLFIAFLEEKPARCVWIEDHSDAEDEGW